MKLEMEHFNKMLIGAVLFIMVIFALIYQKSEWDKRQVPTVVNGEYYGTKLPEPGREAYSFNFKTQKWTYHDEMPDVNINRTFKPDYIKANSIKIIHAEDLGIELNDD